MKTYSPKAGDIKRDWHIVDVSDQTLGRVATKIALLLSGKAKPYFVRHLDCGDYVVVTNAAHIKVSGKKLSEKMYSSYSGYPGGLRKESLKDLLVRRPTEVMKHAVMGMLPKNKLRDRLIQRLYVFPEGEHTYGDKFKMPKAK